MNAKKFVAAIALIAAAGSAMADVASPSAEPIASTKTRAEVIAQFKQARENGLLARSDSDYPVTPAFVSTRTRTEVVAELKQAQAHKNGLMTTFQR